ncbi:MAG: hypothetical protein V2J02_18585 [Pseudomonadales bacterium]|nr:hypothetical protein [Pseudomonadales bacterium]
MVEIAQDDPMAAACLATIVEQLEADQDLLDRLTQQSYGHGPRDLFDVSRWQRLWKRPHEKDLWRLKSFQTEVRSYRIIYAFSPTSMEYCILAFVYRPDFDYDDPAHPITERVLAAYELLREN